MKYLIIGVLYLALSFENASAYTILIDPGHGGEDHGARSAYFKWGKRKTRIQEKDIVLDLAKKIYKRLKKKKYNVYLTRSIDRTLSLGERAAQAEKIQANLIVSIHANASKRKKATGFETYYLDNHEDSAVKKVESLENKDLSGEELVVNQILTDLVIQKTVEHSKKLANNIHNNLVKKVGRKFKLTNRGIKPGLFYVLAMSKRPGVLLEVGFLSNSKEAKKIMRADFQKQYASAVVGGIDKFVMGQIKKNPNLF